jgi:hypothetical protein
MKYAPAPRKSIPMGKNDRLIPAATCGGERKCPWKM